MSLYQGPLTRITLMSHPIAQRITGLRHWLIQQGLDALIVPHEDEYLGEYVPIQNERLEWVTGFTGSAVPP